MEKCPIHGGSITCPFCGKTVANEAEAQEQWFIPYFHYVDENGKWTEYENPVCAECTDKYMIINSQSEAELLPNVPLPDNLRVSGPCEFCIKLSRQ